MSTNPKDEPQYALVIKVQDKDVGKSHTDSGHDVAVSTSFGIGISLEEDTFKITDTVQSGQAYCGGARKGDYLVGVNGVRLAGCMVKPFSVKEFSQMMAVAERPLVLNINHIAKKTVTKKKAPPAPPMPPAKTGNPMICVFVFCLALSAVVVGVLMEKGDDKPIVSNKMWNPADASPNPYCKIQGSKPDDARTLFGFLKPSRSLVERGHGSVRFTDFELMSLLAFAMADSYNNIDNKLPNFNDAFLKCGKANLEVVKQAREDVGLPVNDENYPGIKTGSVWYTVYKITKEGPHKGKTILAYMGTLDKTSGWGLSVQATQDEAMAKAEEPIRSAITAATNVIKAVKPDYVTGHSLGGFLAETAFSYNPVSKGASFGAPGAFSCNAGNNLLNPDESVFKGTEFNSVINWHDSIAMTIGPAIGSQWGHISAPDQTIWPTFGGYVNKLSAHSVKGYTEAKIGNMGCIGDGGSWAFCTYGDKKQYSNGAGSCRR